MNKKTSKAKIISLEEELANLTVDISMSKGDWVSQEAQRLKVSSGRIFKALKDNEKALAY